MTSLMIQLYTSKFLSFSIHDCHPRAPTRSYWQVDTQDSPWTRNPNSSHGHSPNREPGQLNTGKAPASHIVNSDTPTLALHPPSPLLYQLCECCSKSPPSIVCQKRVCPLLVPHPNLTSCLGAVPSFVCCAGSLGCSNLL